VLLNIPTEKIEANSCATATHNFQFLSDTIRYFESVSNLLLSVGSHLPSVYFFLIPFTKMLNCVF